MTETDELDREKELADRFASHTKEAKDARGSKDAYNTQDTSGTDNASDAKTTDGTEAAADDNDRTRNRRQYVMYLPEELHQALNERFSRYDGISKIQNGTGIEKHKDFNEAVVRAGLNNDHLDGYVGVSSSLDED